MTSSWAELAIAAPGYIIAAPAAWIALSKYRTKKQLDLIDGRIRDVNDKIHIPRRNGDTRTIGEIVEEMSELQKDLVSVAIAISTHVSDGHGVTPGKGISRERRRRRDPP